MTNYSRSVLKSNGLRNPKNLPVKFDFSPIDTSANIAKKLPSQRCSKPLFIAFFNVSHKRPTFAFTSESGRTHSAFGERSHTAAHTAKHWPSGRGRYHYPRSVPHVHKYPRAGCQNGVLCRFGILAGRCSRRTQKAFGTAMRLCVSLFRGAAAPLGRVIFSLLPKLRLVHPALSAFRMCETRGGITTLSALYVLLKRRTAACKSG